MSSALPNRDARLSDPPRHAGTGTLQQLGYQDIAHLDGGITAWIEAGRPAVTPNDA